MSDYSSRVEQARHDSWHPNGCDRCLEQAVEQIDGDYYCARHLPPDPDDVRVYETTHRAGWAAVTEFRTVQMFATEAEAVAWATEDGSGWTPAELRYVPPADWPTFEIVLRVQVNETLAQVQTWPWEDMLNASASAALSIPHVEVTVESTKEVAR